MTANGGVPPNDILSISGILPGGITASAYNPTTGVLTLTGVDTLVRYEQVLASVRYVPRGNDTDDDCFDAAREISWTVGTDPGQTQRTRVAIRLHA